MTAFSHSRLAAYERCPHCYRQRYRDALEGEQRERALPLSELTPRDLPAFLGTIFHRNLRDFYRGLQRGECLTETEQEQQFERFWREAWVEELRRDPGRLDEYGGRGRSISARWGCWRCITGTNLAACSSLLRTARH